MASDPAIAAVDAYFGRTPFALFVSSAHPPNARGLLDLADGAEKPLADPLVIAGGAQAAAIEFFHFHGAFSLPPSRHAWMLRL